MIKTLVATAATALALAPGTAAAGPFVEPAKVLHTWTGEPDGYFGWAVSELGDVDGDRVGDVITSEPFAHGNAGVTWVLSGRTGERVHRFDGEPGDFQGAAIADAGDADRDGVNDIISGASGTEGPGRAYLFSGRTGLRLHVWEGEAPLDNFGAAVSSAGDQDRDGHDDVLVGAPFANGGAGALYVYSGRTRELLREIVGAAGDGLGSATDWIKGRGRPDFLAGAQGSLSARRYDGRTGAVMFDLPRPEGAAKFGTFFVAALGRDIYAGDYAANGGAGHAAMYSGRDGSLIHEWPGRPGDGTGPGREALDVDRDGRIDVAVGSYTADDVAPDAGRVDIYSGRTGERLRSFVSTTANENLGFDALGIPDVNRDHQPDLLLSAAEGDTLYLVAGERPSR